MRGRYGRTERCVGFGGEMNDVKFPKIYKELLYKKLNYIKLKKIKMTAY